MTRPAKYLVSGATGGVGTALCRRLVAAGHSLYLVGRDGEKTARLADELEAPHSVWEATEPELLGQCFRDAADALGGLDGVAHCVGSLLLKPAHNTTPEEWDNVIAVNLSSAFHVLRAAVPALRKSGGSLVLISSAAARIGLANHEAIAAGKAGLIGLALSAAATYAPQGIRVNCVAPGLIETSLTSRITSNERSLEASKSMHALGRIGQPEEVASAIEWLLDSEQSWITGQVLGIDGGLGSIRSRK